MNTKPLFLSLFTALAFAAACGDAPRQEEPVETNTDEARTRTCGGIANLPCPDGFECVDDPRDDCDPAAGGADCGGVCRKSRCRYNDPNKQYVARSTAECSTIRFICVEGTQYFSDQCGCGCETASVPCGPSTCGAGQVCCNESCGICTEPGGFCTQQYCGN
jgi:hypothetical protein